MFKFSSSYPLIRNVEAGALLEDFLVAAISSILIIRFFLKITGYPQVGGEGLHIAHMLWGGLFMGAAIILTQVFINREVKNLAAVVGGVGFGVFIDEVGKFITSDNNYFYQPAVALIYIIFVFLFLLYRSLERNQKLSRREYLMNALEISKDIISHNFDKKDKRRVLSFLKKSDSENPVADALTEMVSKIEASQTEENGFFDNAKESITDFYEKLVEKNWFKKAVITFFVISSLFFLTRALIFLGSANSLVETGQFVFTTISGLFVVAGIFSFRNSNLDAFLMFKRSVLVSILLTQPLLFFSDQFFALIGLGFNLIILFTLQFLIESEKLQDRKI